MKKGPIILFLIILAVFLVGLVQLFRLRFAFGDVYPEYSSLRADPSGSKAFFESLSLLKPTQRHFKSAAKLPDPSQTTLFYLGAHPRDLKLPPPEYQALETWIRRGGRFVLALNPSGPSPVIRLEGGDQPSLRDLESEWEFDTHYRRWTAFQDKEHEPVEALLQAPMNLPPSFMAHSDACFTNLVEEWSEVYGRPNGSPVLIERSWGEGRIVVCADAFHLSNQAMLMERYPRLLAWLAGSSQHFVFDEAHLGVRSEAGIATLARKYRLGTVFLASLFLAGLFIWKNALPFLPARPSVFGQANSVTGREARAGFLNLLQRHIPREDIMENCLNQWNLASQRGMAPPRHRLERMQELIEQENRKPPNERNPIQLYNRFAELLSQSHKPR